MTGELLPIPEWEVLSQQPKYSQCWCTHIKMLARCCITSRCWHPALICQKSTQQSLPAISVHPHPPASSRTCDDKCCKLDTDVVSPQMLSRGKSTRNFRHHCPHFGAFLSMTMNFFHPFSLCCTKSWWRLAKPYSVKTVRPAEQLKLISIYSAVTWGGILVGCSPSFSHTHLLHLADWKQTFCTVEQKHISAFTYWSSFLLFWAF